jgi:hypothetical protein
MGDVFQRLVLEFDDGFRNRPRAMYQFSRPYDDFAVFEIEESRIAAAYANANVNATPDMSAVDNSAPDCSVLALAVSYNAPEDLKDAMTVQQERLLRAIVTRIQRMHPTDTVLWSQIDGGFGPDEFDALVVDAYGLDSSAAAAAEPGAAAAASGDDAAQDRSAVLEDAEVLDAGEPVFQHRARFAPVEEVVDSLTERTSIPPTAAAQPAPKAEPRRPNRNVRKLHPVEPQVVANALPDVPQPMLSEAARIRRALYPEPEDIETPEKPNLPQRLTTYTLNTALIIVVMPVGVAMLTYNVLGRENQKMTARAMALTGFGYAISHTTEFGQALLGLV